MELLTGLLPWDFDLPFFTCGSDDPLPGDLLRRCMLLVGHWRRTLSSHM
jgi:hypothetical protein